MKPSELIKRYLFFFVSLWIMAFGIAFSIKADLGTSPISSFPYVLSLITPLTVGTVTILMHCAFITLQILILRRQYQLVQLIQLPVALVFGVMTDLALWIVRNVTYTAYWQQWALCLIGIALVGFGVRCEVTARVVTLAGEGLILAIVKVSSISFSTMKIVFDVTLVALACICSFAFLHGLYGVREGTLAAALLVGTVAKWLQPILRRFEHRWIGEI